MTKKDYELAATIAQEADNEAGRRTVSDAELIIEGFVILFKVDGNPNFDEDRFRRACVPGANVKARN